MRVACGLQYPLRLAYAIAVHKCQGMTLGRVVVDLRSAFTFRQAYVALSRARDMKHLTVRSLSAGSVGVHEGVRRYYEEPQRSGA